MLGLVRDILPPVTTLLLRSERYNKPTYTDAVTDKTAAVSARDTSCDERRRRHYAIVESDHPYKPAAVHNYRVTFESRVTWMTVEFDCRCGTAQNEDSLQLYVPAVQSHARNSRTTATTTTATATSGASSSNLVSDGEVSGWWPVLSKFSGVDGWPTSAVILPGNYY